MFQDELFSNSVEQIPLNEGDVTLHRSFMDFKNANKVFELLINDLNWKQDSIRIYGRALPIPRLNAWYGDKGCNYKYSGIQMETNNWSDSLNMIRDQIEKSLSLKFNSCLANLYRNGQDSVSWHSDDEAELGKNPTICSVSFGEERKFQIRNKQNKNDKETIILTHNSVLIMQGNTQHIYEHQVPKELGKLNPRINLTFRNVY